MFSKCKDFSVCVQTVIITLDSNNSAAHNRNSFQECSFPMKTPLFQPPVVFMLFLTHGLSKHRRSLLTRPISGHHRWLTFITVPLWCESWLFGTHTCTQSVLHSQMRQAPYWNYKLTVNCRYPCGVSPFKLGLIDGLRPASTIKDEITFFWHKLGPNYCWWVGSRLMFCSWQVAWVQLWFELPLHSQTFLVLTLLVGFALSMCCLHHQSVIPPQAECQFGQHPALWDPPQCTTVIYRALSKNLLHILQIFDL